jgi:hypothetical protein
MPFLIRNLAVEFKFGTPSAKGQGNIGTQMGTPLQNRFGNIFAQTRPRWKGQSPGAVGQVDSFD